MTGPKPPITLDQYRRLLEVRRLRAAIPSDKELARELGVAPYIVASAIGRGYRHHDAELSKEVQP